MVFRKRGEPVVFGFVDFGATVLAEEGHAVEIAGAGVDILEGTARGLKAKALLSAEYQLNSGEGCLIKQVLSDCPESGGRRKQTPRLRMP